MISLARPITRLAALYCLLPIDVNPPTESYLETRLTSEIEVSKTRRCSGCMVDLGRLADVFAQRGEEECLCVFLSGAAKCASRLPIYRWCVGCAGLLHGNLHGNAGDKDRHVVLLWHNACVRSPPPPPRHHPPSLPCPRACRAAEEISGDLFDLLIGLGDFEEFKSLMLSFKEQVAGERGAASPSGPGVCLCLCARVCVRACACACVCVAAAPVERGCLGGASRRH